MPNANIGEAATKNNNFVVQLHIRDCNELYLQIPTRIHWRASLVPAVAVIPAPRAYINVVAVKKPVVGFEGIACGGRPRLVRSAQPSRCGGVLFDAGTETPPRSFGALATSESLRSNGSPAVVTVSKTECSRQLFVALNVKAWNDKGSTA